LEPVTLSLLLDRVARLLPVKALLHLNLHHKVGRFFDSSKLLVIEPAPVSTDVIRRDLFRITLISRMRIFPHRIPKKNLPKQENFCPRRISTKW
jgi:hypothetical protein